MAAIITRDGDYLITTWPDGTVERLYWPDGAVVSVPPSAITELDIKRGLTATERAAIRAAVATDEQVADWLDYLQSAARSGRPIAVDDADLRAGFLRLRDLGVFTTDRLLELQAALLDG